MIVCDGETCYDDGTGDGEMPDDWLYSLFIDNGDGTLTNPDTGEIFDPITGAILGNANEPPDYNMEPDMYGDVYSVDGTWVGNIYGDGPPGQAPGSGRGPAAGGSAYGSGSGGTLGGGSSSGGGGNDLGQLIKALQNMLAQSRQNGGNVQQQAALVAALRNAQAKQGQGLNSILVAGLVALGVVALTR